MATAASVVVVAVEVLAAAVVVLVASMAPIDIVQLPSIHQVDISGGAAG